MNRHPALWPLLCLGLLGRTVPAAEPEPTEPAANVVRDPTVPPAAARAPAAPAAGQVGAAPAPETGAPPRHLMVVQGKPYVIERGRPHGVGDRLGEARIERIEGSSVWLRDASGLRKISLYPGVEIRPVKQVTKEASP